jgi:hypothetical protein
MEFTHQNQCVKRIQLHTAEKPRSRPEFSSIASALSPGAVDGASGRR